MKQSKYNRKRIWALLALLCVVVGLIPFKRYVRRNFESILQIMRGKKTVAARIAEYGPSVRKRLVGDFKRLGMKYPASSVILLFIKKEMILEVWVSSDSKKYVFLKIYPILGASGHLGPKLKEGDGQVPEGIYHIDSLNPNSGFHLSIRLDYPNDFDRRVGKLDGRINLGSDIMIHGNTCSVGCLAMGDNPIEDLFVLCAETGVENVKIIIAPYDFRKNKPATIADAPKWLPKLYSQIKKEMRSLPREPQNNSCL